MSRLERERECQIRSQHKHSSLTIFSPKPPSRPAIFWALTLSMLVISSYKALYFRHFWLLFLIICLAIFLPVHLRS
ncbi:hypothetical protein BDE02_07G025200 [Populus trichocarpa]|nr:hypothetical protein BDE02_07G025200 [Populus trichocarpa]